MLFVVSVPNEYGAQLKREAHSTGRRIKDLIRDMLANNFSVKENEGADDEILKIVKLANSSSSTHPAYKWNRQEIYDRF